MKIHYCFDYSDDICEIEYDYEPKDITECVNEWFANQDKDALREEMREYGYDIDDPEDRMTWATEDDDFAEFAYRYYEDAARDAFPDDEEVQNYIDNYFNDAAEYSWFGQPR